MQHVNHNSDRVIFTRKGTYRPCRQWNASKCLVLGVCCLLFVPVQKKISRDFSARPAWYFVTNSESKTKNKMHQNVWLSVTCGDVLSDWTSILLRAGTPALSATIEPVHQLLLSVLAPGEVQSSHKTKDRSDSMLQTCHGRSHTALECLEPWVCGRVFMRFLELKDEGSNSWSKRSSFFSSILSLHTCDQNKWRRPSTINLT